MPLVKGAVKEEDGDINRLPDSESEDSDRGAIEPTDFTIPTQKPAWKTRPVKNGKKGGTINGNDTINGTNTATRKGTALSQNGGTRSPKRKSQELGKGMEDVYGRPNAKKVKKTFGSSSRSGSSQPSSSAGSHGKSAKAGKKLKRHEDLLEIPQTPQKKGFKSTNVFKSPSSTPEPRRNMSLQSPLKDEESSIQGFRDPGVHEIDELSESHHDLSSPVYDRKPQRKKGQAEVEPSTQYPAFRIPGENFDELSGATDSMLGEEGEFRSGSVDGGVGDVPSATLNQQAYCPMCNEPVDPVDLKEFGNMNTRAQEKFCRFHQQKTAQKSWDAQGYPAIDWGNLDDRIAKHYSLIRKVINGGGSYYRDLLEENVNAGKDRNPLKMTSNLTPGYYGGRGLRAMSENIMHEFTALIKQKAVKDRRISSRGPTAFVQSVLVPEVAVLLIMEDMNVGVDRAREILEDSSVFGELLHDEVRDVVDQRVEDSEDGDGDEFDQSSVV